MQKKKILIIVIGGVLVISLILFSSLRKREITTISPFQAPEATPKEEIGELVNYEDSAGFSFKYTESLTVKDITPDEETFYTLLELSSDKFDGKLLIKVVDTPYSSVDNWLKKDKEASTAGALREITLSEMSGKQVQLANPRRLVTVVINEEIMYYIESPLEEANTLTGKQTFWNKTHNDIVSNFSLIKEEKPVPEDPDNETVTEEEEIIE